MEPKVILLHSEKFAGDTVTAEKYGPDYQIKINARNFGIYTSVEAGINAARESITQQLKRQ